MGYTHYWTFRSFSEADALGCRKALPALRDIVKRHRRLLVYGGNHVSRPPQVNLRGICLNGRGEGGHESFWFRLPSIGSLLLMLRRQQRPLPYRRSCITTQVMAT